MESDLLQYMHDQITVEPMVKQLGNGRREYGAPVVWQCMYVDDENRVLTQQGNWETTMGTGYGPCVDVDGATLIIEPNARITLPDGSQPNIVKRVVYKDEDGSRYGQVVFLGN